MTIRITCPDGRVLVIDRDHQLRLAEWTLTAMDEWREHRTDLRAFVEAARKYRHPDDDFRTIAAALAEAVAAFRLAAPAYRPRRRGRPTWGDAAKRARADAALVCECLALMECEDLPLSSGDRTLADAMALAFGTTRATVLRAWEHRKFGLKRSRPGKMRKGF